MGKNNNNNKKSNNIPLGSVDDAANVVKDAQQNQDASGEENAGADAEDKGGAETPQPDKEQDQEGGGSEAGAQEDKENAEGAEKNNGAEGDQQGGASGEENAGAGVDAEPAEAEPEKDNEGIPGPAPDEAGCQKFAKQLSNSPAHLDAFRRTLVMADELIANRNKGAKKTTQQLEADTYQRLVKTYGTDFVTAKKGNNSMYYSRKAWNQMGKNKRGWVETTKTMPEVAGK